jgi:hypothetical protein
VGTVSGRFLSVQAIAIVVDSLVFGKLAEDRVDSRQSVGLTCRGRGLDSSQGSLLAGNFSSSYWENNVSGSQFYPHLDLGWVGSSPSTKKIIGA